MKLLEERKNIIDEIIENMTRENTESLEKARKVGHQMAICFIDINPKLCKSIMF